MKGLKEMDLSHSDFSNDALSEIHCLESLHHLDLTECVGINPRCFIHLISLNLRSIQISADICQVVGETMLDCNVGELNKLPSLKEVFVYSIRSRSGRDGLAVISNSLCHNMTWRMKLKATECGTVMWTTFTR